MKRNPWLALGLASLLLAGLSFLGPYSARVEGSTRAPTPTRWNLLHTCTYCHNPHGGPNTANLWDEDVEILCLTCHGPGGVAVSKAANHEGNTCLVCHDKHKHLDNWLGGENIKTVGRDHGFGLALIETPNGNLKDVVFESRGTTVGQPALHSFADDDLDNNNVRDGLCEVCHVEEGVDNHNFGQTCTVCHAHVDGFEEP